MLTGRGGDCFARRYHRENTVVGAGSDVAKDMPPDCVAVGNPCKVMRRMGARNGEYYFRDYKIEL